MVGQRLKCFRQSRAPADTATKTTSTANQSSRYWDHPKVEACLHGLTTVNAGTNSQRSRTRQKNKRVRSSYPFLEPSAQDQEVECHASHSSWDQLKHFASLMVSSSTCVQSHGPDRRPDKQDPCISGNDLILLATKNSAAHGSCCLCNLPCVATIASCQHSVE